MKILVADDHTLMRAGLISLLARLPEMEVVGEAADGREALRMVRDLKPDLVLMDIAMPGLNGLESAERIHGIHPGIKIIILSMHASEEYVAQALKAGASGYLLKDAATAELEMALKSVSMGQFYLSPAISRSEEHTSELQSRRDLVCRLLLEKKKQKTMTLECQKQIKNKKITIRKEPKKKVHKKNEYNT